MCGAAGLEADTSASTTGEPVPDCTRALPRTFTEACTGSVPDFRPEALADAGEMSQGFAGRRRDHGARGERTPKAIPGVEGELDGQDELSAYGATEQQRDGFLCRLQREDAVEGRRHLTGVDETREHREVGGVLPAYKRAEALAHER